MLLRQSGGVILASSAEHPSVRENCLILERLGKRVGFIGVEQDGRVSPATLENALEKHRDARFAAIMGVNNETGAKTDLPALARILRDKRIHLHCDMVQTAGKVPADVTYADSASLSAHKLGGPRGMGLLYLRKPLNPIYAGGGQERGIRPGTENVAGAFAMADCLERRLNAETVQAEYHKASERFSRLIRGLRLIPGCRLIPEDRLDEDQRFSPYILQAAFKRIPGEVMVRALDDAGFAVSTGSACSASSQERPVLAAMGVDKRTAREGIRVSQGWSTTMEEIDRLLEALTDIISRFGFGEP
jgi:cysteine desulfurase